MFHQVFADYLTAQGALRQEQADYISRMHNQEKPYIGEIAVQKGLMSTNDVWEINRKQIAHDAPFGAIAVESGYLTQGQVKDILACQTSEDQLIKTMLVDSGYLSVAELEKYFSQFKADYHISEADWQKLLENDVDTYFKIFAGLEDQIMQSFARLFVKCMIRLVDRKVTFGKAFKAYETYDYVSLQDSNGDIKVMAGLALTEQAALSKFAQAFAKTEDLDAADVEDSVKEFLNNVSGLFVASLEKMGIDNSLKVPVFKNDAPLDTWVLPIYTEFGEVYCLIRY